MIKRIPMRRLGRPEDLDGAFLLLATDASALDDRHRARHRRRPSRCPPSDARRRVPRFTVNIGMLFAERPFLDRIAAAQGGGLRPCRVSFPLRSPDRRHQGRARERQHAHERSQHVARQCRTSSVSPVFPAAKQISGSRFAGGRAYARGLGASMIHVMAGVAPAAERAAGLVDLREPIFAPPPTSAPDITLLLEPLNHRSRPGYLVNRSDEIAELIAEIGPAEREAPVRCLPHPDHGGRHPRSVSSVTGPSSATSRSPPFRRAPSRTRARSTTGRCSGIRRDGFGGFIGARIRAARPHRGRPALARRFRASLRGAGMPNPVLVEVLRGDTVESAHCGAVAVVDADGGVVQSLGDIGRPVFPRSAVKAHAGAAARSRAAPPSASASPMRSWFSPARPIRGEARASRGGRRAAGQSGTRRRRPRMRRPLAARRRCRPGALGIRTDGRRHSTTIAPASMRASSASPARSASSRPAMWRPTMRCSAPSPPRSAEVTGAPPHVERRGIDGCSIPTYAVPLAALALGFARFGTGHTLRAAARRRRAAAAGRRRRLPDAARRQRPLRHQGHAGARRQGLRQGRRRGRVVRGPAGPRARHGGEMRRWRRTRRGSRHGGAAAAPPRLAGRARRRRFTPWPIRRSRTGEARASARCGPALAAELTR